jgi:hypothetical protein
MHKRRQGTQALNVAIPVVLYFAAVVSLAACSESAGMRGEIISRVKGKVASAVITKDAGSAIDHPVYRVYIDDGSTMTEVLNVVRVQGLEYEWQSETLLLVRMQCGQVNSFGNLVMARGQSGSRENVQPLEVRLESGGLCRIALP